MITVRYAQALRGIKFNLAAPGEIANRKWVATDMNKHTGQLTVTEGTDSIINLAMIDADGPTGELHRSPWPRSVVTAAHRQPQQPHRVADHHQRPGRGLAASAAYTYVPSKTAPTTRPAQPGDPTNGNRREPCKEILMNLTLNLALWIAAGLLAVVMLNAATKLFVPKEKLATKYGRGWVEDFSPGTVKAIGALELLAAVGLILPAALEIAPLLVPLAAVGVVLLMVGATITHLRRHEAVPAVLTLTFLALAAFVAWGRFGPEPFTG